MGGQGSGRWYFPDRKRTVEESYRISTRDVFFKGQTPRPTWEGWYVAGTKLGWSFELSLKGLTFWRENYKCFVKMDKTPCHFGGERWWFKCPQCERRIIHLYLQSHGFLCRHCLDLSYKTRRESLFGRSCIRAEKLVARVGAKSVEGMRRPKGMHYKTFNELYSRALDEEIASLAAMLGPTEIQKIYASL